jgi:hypothetical protein
MDIEQAHEIIGSRPGESLAQIEQRYAKEFKSLSSRIKLSALPAQSEAFKARLGLLEEAIGFLRRQLGPGSAVPPTTRDSGPLPPGPGVFVEAPPRKVPWIVPSAVVSVLIIAVVILFFPKGKSDHSGNPTPAPSATPDMLGSDLARVGGLIKQGNLIGAAESFPALLTRHGEKPEIIQTRDELLAALSSEAANSVRVGNNRRAVEIYKVIVKLAPSHPLAAASIEQMTTLGTPQGRVVVTSNPPGALVVLYQSPNGKDGFKPVAEEPAPAEFSDLPYGHYAALIKLPGYAPEQAKPFALEGSRSKEIAVKLQRETGAVKLVGGGTGADFVLRLKKAPARQPGGEAAEIKGEAPTELKDLPTGVYELNFPGTGITQEVVVEKGVNKEVVIVGSAGGAPVTDAGIISLRTDRSAYRVGDNAEVSVSSRKDGYIRVYNVDTSGNCFQIYPNFFEKSGRIQAGQSITFPGSEVYTLPIQLPEGHSSGKEKLHAVFSTLPFTDLSAASYSADYPFLNLGMDSDEDRRSRGVPAGGESGETVVTYSIN